MQNDMTKYYQISVLMLLVAFTFFTACKKQNETTLDSFGEEINALADQAVTGMDLQEVDPRSVQASIDHTFKNPGL
jgi:hypothetical protein